ncbi:metallopeptidase family protein [Candidatus Aerophobetes bacterium]|nr:metallopeptidase family protein [Candidatus Aerophobetes bacterium]
MIQEDKLEQWVQEALESLPRILREKLDNIHIVVEDEPPAKLRGIYPSKSPVIFLGLYEGIPLAKRGIYYSGITPDRITIFRRSIEKICPSEEKRREVVIKTVLHEIGHYFGLGERELREIEGKKF